MFLAIFLTEAESRAVQNQKEYFALVMNGEMRVPQEATEMLRYKTISRPVLGRRRYETW